VLQHERWAWASGHVWVAGVDEAGRGPLAGPVVAAAVAIDPGHLESEAGGLYEGLNDSKQLAPERREHFYALLRQSDAVRIGIGHVEPADIDRHNILRATHLAMRRALEALLPDLDHALVDGHPVPTLPCASTAIVGGDTASLSIAAASVVAKVTRDATMLELDRCYPAYGFARHKGYCTREHLDALRRLGPSPCHRRSFHPVKQLHLDL